MNQALIEILVKMHKKRGGPFGRKRVRSVGEGGSRKMGQRGVRGGRCEPKIEVIVKMKKIGGPFEGRVE